MAHAEVNSSSTQQVNGLSSGAQTEENKDENLLDQIPRWIDATPTIFPEQSNEPIVPPTEQTEDQTWFDRKQKKIRNWADRTSGKIDNWFGEVAPQKPASATIRVMIDNYWNEYDNYEIKPRIRGKIKLPTLEKRLSVVFGDDSLDDEFNNSPANINQNPNQDPNKKLDGKRTRDDNSSIALRWSNFSKKLPFETDADLGIRSGDDIYVRLKASRDWQLRNDFKFYAEQIYRYGIDSENYLRTNLELTHARPNQPILSNQFSLTYADDQDDDLTWENRLFREHSFFANNRFNYGIYTGGYYNDNDLRLNSWGPFVSWRQPVLREWFFVQGDLNYFNDHREDRNHYVSTFLRLEALF
ncbi:putative selenocysteine synthase [Acinetobacter baumannii 25691_2]|nr:putative selenocysteine synthase [Acinetobacter baumannii 25691_2]